MADVIYKGLYTALQSGDLDGTPDIRYALFMSGFSFDADAVNLSDGTLDEFDGVGYSRQTAADVTFAYIDADDEMQFDSANVEFGDPIAPGTDDIEGLAVILHVDGDPDNDILLASTTAGGFGVNANNGSLSLVLPATGLLFVRQAA